MVQYGVMTVSDLKEAVIIVTGASSGIGEATARALHAAGARPVLAARRADRLTDLSAELDGALHFTVDVTQPDDVRRLVTGTLARYGRIDGLVNNAGASLSADVADVDLGAFRQVLELNVVAPVSLMQAVVPTMRGAGRGTIVNVSSGTTRRVAVGLSPYASSKAAVNMLTLASRAELAGAGIDVSLLVPFITATEFAGGQFQGPDVTVAGGRPHSAGYVAAVILRLLRTGEERIDLLPGPEDVALTQLP
jgi:NADP-dependent 3-hydroxy acid dehydrogenase YdfG